MVECHGHTSITLNTGVPLTPLRPMGEHTAGSTDLGKALEMSLELSSRKFRCLDAGPWVLGRYILRTVGVSHVKGQAGEAPERGPPKRGLAIFFL